MSDPQEPTPVAEVEDMTIDDQVSNSIFRGYKLCTVGVAAISWRCQLD